MMAYEDTPEAGPSRLIDSEDSARRFFQRKRREYLDLERHIQESDELLSSLSSYLSTFQTDLSAVSGHVADLQQSSSEIESQLDGRRTVLPALNALLGDITLPPTLVLTLRDTQPAQNPDMWLTAIAQLDSKIAACRARQKVAAATEMEGIIDGLRLKALAQLPPFLLQLIRPLRSASKGLSTNLAVLQTSLLLKYQPFYAFLQRQSPKTAKMVERGYVNAARSYFETGLRRYARALGVVKAKGGEAEDLRYAAVESEAEVVLVYQADDKDFHMPVEGLFRSLNLVLLDNASAEFTFIVRFFARGVEQPDLKDAERIWHEVFDPALESCDQFLQSILLAPPGAIPLLAMIRLNDRVLEIAETRGAVPLVAYLQKQRLALWPLYRKDMDKRVEEMKRMADEAGAKGLVGLVGKGVKDNAVRQAASRYAALYRSTVALSEEADEMMVFASLTRLRNELIRLVQLQSGKIKATNERQSYLSTIYEVTMHELVVSTAVTNHPRMVSELAFFRAKEEEARKKLSG